MSPRAMLPQGGHRGMVDEFAGDGSGGGTASGWLATTGGNDFSIVEASEPNITPSAADNGPNLNAWITAKRAAGGGRFEFGPGKFKVKTGITDNFITPGAGLQWVGIPGATFIEADGPLLAAGTLLTLDKSRDFSFRDISFSATSQRTGGIGVQILGALAAPVSALDLQNLRFDDVNIFKQAGAGLQLLDNAGGLGVQGFYWTGGFMSGLAPGAVGIDVATPNGELIRIKDIIHTETPGALDANRPLATLQLRAVADFRGIGIESVYCRYGLRVVPGVGLPAGNYTCNTVWLERCIWGQVTQKAALLDTTIAGAGTQTIFGLKAHDNYVDGTDGTLDGWFFNGAIQSCQVTDLAAFVCLNGLVISALSQGARCSGVILGACGTGIVAGNNASDFDIDFSFGFSNAVGGSGIGTNIGAGCNHYAIKSVGAQQWATTPLSDSGGPTKVIIANV